MANENKINSLNFIRNNQSNHHLFKKDANTVFDFTKSKIPYLAIALCILISLWQLSLFVYPLKWDALDITFPWRYFVIDAMQNGILPTWNPFQHHGVAQGTFPQTWYPPAILLGLWGGYSIATLNIEYLLHLFIAAWGFYRLAAIFNIKTIGKIWGTLVFPLSGFFIGNAQHLGWIVAAAWLPHLFVSFFQFKKTFQWHWGLQICLYSFLLLSGGYIAYSIIALYILVIWALVDLIKVGAKHHPYRIQMIEWGRLLLLICFTCSVLLVCFYDLKLHISRGSGLSDAASMVGSFHWKGLISLLFPFSTVHEYPEFWHADQSMLNIYVSWLGFLLAVLSLSKLNQSFYRHAWIMVILAFIISMGESLPLRKVLNHLPLFNLFRFPSLFRYFAILGLTLIGAKYLGEMQKDASSVKVLKKGAKILFLFFLLLFIFLSLNGNQWQSPWIWSIKTAIWVQSLVHAFLAGLLILAWTKFRNVEAFFLAILMITAGDLGISAQLNGQVSIFNNTKIKDITNCTKKLPKGYPLPPASDRIGSNFDRELHFSSVYRNTNSLYKRIGWDGYTPYQYVEYEILEKSPSFTKVLDLPLVFLTKLHAKPDSLPYYSFDQRDVLPHDISWIDFKPNYFELKLDIQTPSLLVFNQNFHTGWKIKLNGTSVTPVKTEISLIGVVIPPGTNHVQLSFQPGNLINTLWISGLLFLIIWFSLLGILNCKVLMIFSGIIILIPLFKILNPPNQEEIIELEARIPALVNASGKVEIRNAETAIIDRFLDKNDLPRFKETLQRIPGSFLYLTKKKCCSSDLFLSAIQEIHSVVDTNYYGSYLGYSVAANSKSNILFSAANHFEMIPPEWTGSEDISNDNYANHFQNLGQRQYSSTYIQPLPIIDIQDQLSIKVAINIRNYDGYTSKLICAVTNENGQFKRLEKTLPSYLESTTQWITWKSDFLISGDELTVGDSVSIYIWNPRLEQLEIDNFEVKILVEQPTFRIQ